MSVSPHERLIAFTASAGDGNGGLWIRPIDSAAARLLPDTEGARFPFWSPASDAVGFFASGKLWTIELPDGRPRAISSAPNGRGGTWNQNGVIVFAPEPRTALHRVSSSGGAATPLTTLDRQRHTGHLWPEFLPDGQRFLFLADGENTPDTHHLYVGRLDGGQQSLFPHTSNVAFLRDGYLLFMRDRQLLAQPFDADRLALSGEPHVLSDRVQQTLENDHKGDFAASSSRMLIYRAMQSPTARLVWRDRERALSPLTVTPAEYVDPELSPDGTRVAMARFEPQISRRFGYGIGGVRSDVMMVDRKTGQTSPFITHPAADWGPVWSPDGTRLVFSSNRSGQLALYMKSTGADAGTEALLPSKGRNPVAQSWSPDGRFLVYSAYDPMSRMDLWLLPLTGEQTPQPLLQTQASEDQAEISHDGRWIAYVSETAGREQVYVQGFPTAEARYQISTGGAAHPRWRADGGELFFLAEDRRLMSVTVRRGETFVHGNPVALFDTGVPPNWYAARDLYDVSRNGEFLFTTPVEDDRLSPITVVINWLTAPAR